MRIIPLREQQLTQVRLSRAELQRLTGCPYVSVGVSDPAQQFYDVRAGSTVGTLVWPDLAVLIRPKVAIINVFLLLGFRPRLAKWDSQTFDYASGPDLLSAMARFLDAEVRDGLRYGISRGYIERSEQLNTLRGRIAIGRQVRRHQTMSMPLECDFVEYTEDIPLNRAIKAALHEVRVVAALDQSVALSLCRAEGAFSDVESVDYAGGNAPAVQFTRLNQRWAAAFRLAEMILRAESLRDESGRVRGIAFTVDMNVLFEKFVEEIVKQEANRAGLVCEPQAHVKLTQQIPMRPDLVIGRAGTTVAVGDAKYIELEPDGWRHANLYQLLAYCTALRLRRGLLIYAGPRQAQTYEVTAAGIELEVVGIDLNQRPSDVVAGTRAAAQRLISQAESPGTQAAS